MMNGRGKKWDGEVERLKAILAGCGLKEEFKWGKPTYTFEGKNVVSVAKLKESAALLFLKGALLKDAKGLLIRPGEHSQSARWMKFTSVEEIEGKQKAIEKFAAEAVKVEKAGVKADKAELVLPEELAAKLKAMPALKKAFGGLTPGRQRGYVLYISGAKQAATRVARVEKCVPGILIGKGLTD